MDNVIIDTDILIDYSKGFSKTLGELKKLQDKRKVVLCVNPIILSEFLTNKNLKDKSRLDEALGFLSSFKTINLNKKMGIITAEILRRNPNLNWKDAMIAANCLTEDCLLATRNLKHFKRISGLKFV